MTVCEQQYTTYYKVGQTDDETLSLYILLVLRNCVLENRQLYQINIA